MIMVTLRYLGRDDKFSGRIPHSLKVTPASKPFARLRHLALSVPTFALLQRFHATYGTGAQGVSIYMSETDVGGGLDARIGREECTEDPPRERVVCAAHKHRSFGGIGLKYADRTQPPCTTRRRLCISLCSMYMSVCVFVFAIQACLIASGVSSFCCFLSFTIYAGVYNKNKAGSGGQFGGGFGLVIWGEFKPVQDSS